MHVYVSGSFSVYDFIVNIYGCDDVEQTRFKFLEISKSGHVLSRNHQFVNILEITR